MTAASVTPRVAFSGDPLRILSARSEGGLPLHEARVVVIGVDARQRGLRKRLRSLGVPQGLSPLRHLVFVIDVDPTRGAWRAVDAFVGTVQARVEREVGRRIVVTGILAAGCPSAELLEARIVHLVTHPLVVPRIVVSWADIRRRDIRDVALEEWC
ncbi:hypothetical protein [Clavibacter zhangzhiyongii]|nr:hypothetical protein [Clavibacter zhangzhiyongii]